MPRLIGNAQVDLNPDQVDAVLLDQRSRFLARARAAATWSKRGAEHEKANHGKRWRYLLIPDHAIANHITLDGLASAHTVVGPEEGK